MTVLFIGTANLDTTAEVTSLPAPGHTVVARATRVGAGGKSANQAAAAGRLGTDAQLIAAIGQDAAGTLLIDALDNAGVDTSTVIRSATAPTGSAFIAVGDDAENLIVVTGGANDTLTPEAVHEKWPMSDQLIVSVALEGPIKPIQAAVERAQQENRRIVLNASPATDAAKPLLSAADPVIVNEHEAQTLVGRSDVTLEDLAIAILALGAQSVVITAGSAGAIVAHGNGTLAKVSGTRVTPVDTTGAGDAFAGALCSELDNGRSLDEAAHFACLVAAHSVQHSGAQSSYPLRGDLQL